MSLYLMKLMALGTMPLTWAVMLALAALVLLALGRRRSAAWLLAAQIGVLWLVSMPWTAFQLTAWREAPFPPVALEETPVADVAVVLGGAVGQVGDPPVENLSGGSNRVLRAARLFRAGKVSHILASGGNLPWLGGPVPEADLMRDLLVEWGVPREAVVTETSSRTTRENALFSADIIRARGWTRVLLVTSAAHMARAIRAFRAVGIEVIPSPTHFGAREAPPFDLLDLFPDTGALGQSTSVIHEVVGAWFYCLKGWISPPC